MALIGPGGMPVTSSPAQNAAADGAASPYIKDSSLATFAADVLEASRDVPVIVDFWAPWCGPCKEELPNVVSAYEKYHSKGFEIVSVSLDQPKDGDKLAKFTKEHNMPWPEIYDGQFWKAEVAQKYYIESIPHAFLIDGSTGMIVAEGDDIRGDKLDPAIQKALPKL